MVYGIVNAPSFIQSFMNDVFSDMPNHFMIVYIDIILVYSKTFPEHFTHVCAVHQHWLGHGLYAKAKICKFYRKGITFLG